MQKTQVPSLGQEDPLEKEMTTHFNILAWEIPWTAEPGGLQFMKSQRHAGQKRLSTHEHTHSLLSQISWVLLDARKRKKGKKEN